MNQKELYTLGIDIGSTTVKIAILDENNEVVFSDYERHFANIQETLSDLLGRAIHKLGPVHASPVITGSGGLTLAKHLGVPFVQEVIAVSTALQDYAPQTDVAIELGGEDAKIIYFEGGNVEQRMNGVCAGGTGSFIDQMASLLQTDASGLNEYAKNYKALYTIAARCGVFAKTDIQPLINDGAAKEDLAASIFQAVVNQTISGLACGKPIRGHVAFLGGPLHFLSELREAFIRTLKLDDEHIIAPTHSHLFAAVGSALNSKKDLDVALIDMQRRLEGKIKMEFEVDRMEPLFATEADFKEFEERHAKHQVPVKDLATYQGKAFLGIDAGSTTTKAALVGEDGTLLYSFYHNNDGDPLGTTISAIKDIYSKLPEGVEIVYALFYTEFQIVTIFVCDSRKTDCYVRYVNTLLLSKFTAIDNFTVDVIALFIFYLQLDQTVIDQDCASGFDIFYQTFICNRYDLIVSYDLICCQGKCLACFKLYFLSVF
jgi:predicted CoA-substrate-specific enzyme activase